MKKNGFDPKEKGIRVGNIGKDNYGNLTGNWETDYYGCWWEVEKDSDKSKYWIIGEYPESYFEEK